MFARVITAQAGAEGFDGAVRIAERQLPDARRRPGFRGYYLLGDDSTGRLSIISLWETREHMEAVAEGTKEGIHDQGAAAAGLTSMRLETFEVMMQG